MEQEMSDFATAMQHNPPRLVVLFQHGPDGSEQFQWGVVGAIPILTLIGDITRLQYELLDDEWMPECDQVACVIAFNRADGRLSHYKHPDIPTDPLVGMFETIKHMLVNSRLGMHAASQKVNILGPDGRPVV